MTQNVVTYTVVVTTDNSSGQLLPYLTANVNFEVAHHEDVLKVPTTALRWRPQPQQVVAEARDAFSKTAHRREGGGDGEGAVPVVGVGASAVAAAKKQETQEVPRRS